LQSPIPDGAAPAAPLPPQFLPAIRASITACASAPDRASKTLRPSSRFQRAQYNAPGAASPQAIHSGRLRDLEWRARIAAGYGDSSFDQRQGKVKGNMIFIGVTIADP
jgi:hypothetical protein